MEIFWRTIAYYNSATWLLQIVIILIGIALTGLLIGKPRPWVKMAMKVYMIGLYTWISVVAVDRIEKDVQKLTEFYKEGYECAKGLFSL